MEDKDHSAALAAVENDTVSSADTVASHDARIAQLESFENHAMARITGMESERAEAISMLRQVCAAHGDNDWDDSLHLADIIEKHLWRNLENKCGFPVFYLAQLRHGYQQLLRGEVKNQHAFARGLIGPAIEAFEKYQVGCGTDSNERGESSASLPSAAQKESF